MSKANKSTEKFSITTELEPITTLELGDQTEFQKELERWRRIAEESEKVPGLVGPSKPRF